MATVYPEVRGQEIQRLIALHRTVQHELDRQAAEMLMKAEQKLAEHRDTGNARVGIEEGDVDRYIYLEDPDSKSGPGAAMSIEYGHEVKNKKGEDKGHVEGLWILHDATGLPRPH